MTSINRQLEVLRRMLKLAEEWGKVDSVRVKAEMLLGERRRERVLSADEQERYLKATETVAWSIEDAYRRALHGLRAM